MGIKPPQIVLYHYCCVHVLVDVPKVVKLQSRCCMNACDKSLVAISSARPPHCNYISIQLFS